MKTGKKVLLVVLAALAVLLGVCAVYVQDYYHADDTALTYLEEGVPGVTITAEDNGEIVFMPDDPQAGLIFYPGAKVAVGAYAPLLCELAEKGICCVAVPAALRIPLLSVNAADGVIERFPQIPEWYIGGHSLGGLTAAMYLEDHADEFSGIVLLGSYTITDLSQADISALLIYGENDGVLNRSACEENMVDLPQDTTEVCIPGGCHAGFGSYGAQDGDGEPTITAEEQWEITADAVADWMGI